MTPTTELAQRIARLFGRRLNTAWSEKEVKRYRQLVKDKCLTGIDQIELIECYYAFQRRKGSNGIHRRDLFTFLNNFMGELDRAKAWQVDKRPPITRYAASDGMRPVSDEEFVRLGDLARAELAKFKAAFSQRET